MAKKKRTKPQPTQSPSYGETVTSSELAEAVGVTTKTLQRWYSHEYRLIPKPQIVRLPGSRGTRAVWPSWVIERGLRVKQLQESGLTLVDVRSVIAADPGLDLRDRLDSAFAPFRATAVALADRVIGSVDLQEIVRRYIAEQASALVSMQGGLADKLGAGCATSQPLIHHLFLLSIFGFAPIAYVDVPSVTLSLKTDIHAGWYISDEGMKARAQHGAVTPTAVLSFSLAPLLTALAEALNDAAFLDVVRDGPRNKPAPLLWAYMPDGAIVEYALAGTWRNSSIGFQAPARRIVSPADASLFETPSAPKSIVDKPT